MSSRTVFHLLEEAARIYGDSPALLQPSTDIKQRYRTCSWNEYLRATQEIAAGLHAQGIRKGDIVALSSETRMEFYLADLGIMTNGSVAAALYPNSPPRDLVRTIKACDAKAVFVEDPKMLRELQDAGALCHWILLTGQVPDVTTLDELRRCGRQAMADDPYLLARVREEVESSDDAVLYLTSGATDEPKMVVVSHGALVANADMGPVALPLGPDDRTVAFLPSAHIAQRVVIEILPIRSGMPVHFFESLIKLPHDLKSVRPTILLAPPRFWERIYSTIRAELNKRPPAARKLFYGALALGIAAARYRRQGRSVPAHIYAPLRVADRLIFRKLRARFGGRLRIAASGAAPLSKDLAEFYEAVGIPLIEGYGLTEGGVVAFNPLDRPKPGSIGKPLPGVEVRLAEDGELLVRSPCLFSVYYKDQARTAEVVRDGWLHTGDIAEIDGEGYIFITGRKKELIIFSTGKKIYPSCVESLFKLEPLISQVLLAGDGLPYLTALITINLDVALTLKGMADWNGRSAEEIVAAPPVTTEVQKVVRRVNQQLAAFKQVRKYQILPRDFSLEKREVTATMKLRRNRVLENFREEIEALYREAQDRFTASP